MSAGPATRKPPVSCPPRTCAAPGCDHLLTPAQRTYCCLACAREGSRRIITAALAVGRASKREAGQ